jgi:SAM-dependent methyltransferase
MGLRLQQLGLTVTGNIHPSQQNPKVDWAIAPFDFEHAFPLSDASFDLVTAFEVIEHVTTTPRHLLSEAGRVLKPGGLLYLGTPNVTSWAKIRRMFSQAHPYDAGAYSLDFGPRHPMCHVFEYDPWTLKQLVASEGFTIVACDTWNPYKSDPRGLRDVALRACVTASLALTGHLKDAAQLWRLRGHQIGLVARKP